MSRDTTIRTWFEEFETATGEKIETIVLLPADDWGRCSHNNFLSEPVQIGSVVERNELPDSFLDREFDSGYGSAEARPFVAYSPSFVVFISEYDGSESIGWIPRHPTKDFLQYGG